MSAKVGVLALQGDVQQHVAALAELGAHPVEIRHAEDVAGVDGIILPGGESTTMGLLLDSAGLRAPLGEALANGLPAFGTCAGMILLASRVLDGRPGQPTFGVIDLAVRRNGFGRQVDSFETDLTIAGIGPGSLHAVFIRAPVVERAGEAVEVLARVDDRPVACRQGPVLATSFHPELSGDLRLHDLFLKGL
ncbi:MAG TPA: pyridoxal 5'-phosphate synthase glutaminase subunit PdxT [Acidimicrobiales bacterium]|nr:pyridoxal 5'-phosphate synthase glutaminase subunit PdxT [Acidimicrobiales bacterium]